MFCVLSQFLLNCKNKKSSLEFPFLSFISFLLILHILYILPSYPLHPSFLSFSFPSFSFSSFSFPSYFPSSQYSYFLPLNTHPSCLSFLHSYPLGLKLLVMSNIVLKWLKCMVIRISTRTPAL